MAKLYPTFLLVFLPTIISAQEVRYFSVADYDLHGKVKTCTVITNYGKEEFQFSPESRLTKITTKYGDDGDYAVTYYKYKNGVLSEKREENYRDGRFDPATSLAHFYSVDTVGQKTITEKILSYDEDFRERYQYVYNPEGQLTSILRNGDGAVDETQVTYESVGEGQLQSYILNDGVQKTVETSFAQLPKLSPKKVKVVFTKNFAEGEPVKAVKEIFDAQDHLLSQTQYSYNEETSKLEVDEEMVQTFNDKGNVTKSTTFRSGSKSSKEYIYQYDNATNPNWVKQIVTPDNVYTTRIITYYEDIKKPADSIPSAGKSR